MTYPVPPAGFDGWCAFAEAVGAKLAERLLATGCLPEHILAEPERWRLRFADLMAHCNAPDPDLAVAIAVDALTAELQLRKALK